MRRELRRHLGLHFFQVGIGVRRAQIAEHGRCAIEQFAGTFHGHNRVVERRRRGILRDLFDLTFLLRHAGFQGRRDVVVLDAIERRQFIRQRDCGQTVDCRPQPGLLFQRWKQRSMQCS